MKLVRFIRQDRPLYAATLFLLTIIATQLVACGGGGSSTSSTKRIPDAYRVSSTSNDTAPIETSAGVDAANTGVLKLRWSAPSTRTDGEPLSLSQIDGYRIYYGKQKGEYVKGADIKDGSAQSATVTGVPVGDYFVVMTTYDSNGIESDYSQAVKKTVML